MFKHDFPRENKQTNKKTCQIKTRSPLVISVVQVLARKLFSFLFCTQGDDLSTPITGSFVSSMSRHIFLENAARLLQSVSFCCVNWDWAKACGSHCSWWQCYWYRSQRKCCISHCYTILLLMGDVGSVVSSCSSSVTCSIDKYISISWVLSFP